MEELLRRYIHGEVSDEERIRVAQWLDEDSSHMREFMALRKLYDISLWQSGKEETSERKEISGGRVRRMAFEVLKIAAVLVVGFWVSTLIADWRPEATALTQAIHVPAGQRAELTLADGTDVWLNSGSTLRFPDRFAADSREVVLEGEGYFFVSRDEERPFTVRTARHAIRVLGTEFNVKAYPGSPLFETALIRGSVEINPLGTTNTLRLEPDEIASDAGNGMVVSRISDYNYFKWTEGLLCFEDESIQSLMDKLELYYDVTIDVRNSSLSRYRYTGKFRVKDGVEHVLRVLQLKHRFNYTKDDDKNLIIIK